MKTQRAVSFDESSMESCLLADHLQSRGLSSSAEQQQHQTQQPQQQQLHHQHKQQLHQTQQQQQQQQSNELLLLGSEEVQSLEEAKRVIGALKARQRAQAHQMLAWRRTLKLQEELVARLTREKADQLRSLSSQLLLFESRLCRKQKEIEASLAQRESIILRQQKVIKQLQSKLRIACNELLVNNNNHHSSSSSKQQDTASLLLLQQTMMRDSSSSPPCCDAFDRLDSLGDSDSAVVLEEAFSDDLTPPRFRSNFTDVTLIRSVSDAVEPKYNLTSRRSNGLLRRPEVLETVYSVEEDADGDNNSGSANNNGKSSSSTTTAAAATGKDHQAPSDEIEADEEDNVSTDATTQQRRRLYQHQHHQQQVQSSSPDENKRLRDIYGSFERLAEHNHQHHRQEHDSGGRSSCKQLLNSHNCCSQLSSNQRNTSRDDSQQAQVTYNRVMSNHRSVTKPKDVKYKRINKAKSKSLEELRGRLRNWVEKGNKIAISLDQSYA